jgi:hypothetical protein
MTLEKPLAFDQLRDALRDLREAAPERSEVVNLRA